MCAEAEAEVNAARIFTRDAQIAGMLSDDDGGGGSGDGGSSPDGHGHAPPAGSGAAGGGATAAAADDDIVRIVISTDNHVGFMERDPVRGHDSFIAFEEVLRHARDTKVRRRRPGAALL